MIVVHSSHVSVGRKFTASAEKAWDLLTDTIQWRLWGPTVRGVACSERHIREGSRGRVLTPIGWWAPFLVTAYEHKHYWAWKVAGIRATGHRVISSGSGACTVFFELPLYWLPYVVVCRVALGRMAQLLGPGKSPV